VDGAEGVHAVEEGAVEVGRYRGREGREIRAQIGGGLHAEAQELAVAGQRHLGIGDVIPPVSVGLERLAAARRPADGPLDLPGRPGADRLLVVEEDLGAEPAAHVGGNDPHLVLGDAQHEGGHEQAVHVWVLRGYPESEVAGGVLVARHAGPRLHGVGHQPLVDDALLDHDVGLLEGGLRLGGIADLPAERHVVRRHLVDLGRALLGGALGGRHRRQRLPVHRDQIGGVVGGVLALGDHHRDRIAHVAGGLAGQRRVRRDLQLGQEPAAGQRVDPGHVLAGEDGDHAGMRLGLGDVDAADLRVAVRAPHERGIGHAGKLEVVGVVALAGDEAGVLAPLDARAE
jgi:hypothetical protein